MCDGGFVPAKPLDTRLLVSDGGTLRDGGTTDADGGVTGVKQPIPCGCSSAGLGDWGALFAAMYVLRRFAARRLH